MKAPGELGQWNTRQLPAEHKETYYDTKAEAIKRLGAVSAEGNICLLITPHDHQGKRYLRRAIRDRETIYCEAIPIPPQK